MLLASLRAEPMGSRRGVVRLSVDPRAILSGAESQDLAGICVRAMHQDPEAAIRRPARGDELVAAAGVERVDRLRVAGPHARGLASAATVARICMFRRRASRRTSSQQSDCAHSEA